MMVETTLPEELRPSDHLRTVNRLEPHGCRVKTAALQSVFLTAAVKPFHASECLMSGG